MLRRDPFERPEELVRRVYAYVAYRIGAGPDAEDVTSETFARALRYRDSFDASRGDVLPWLLGISRRLLASRQPDAGTIASAAEPVVEDPADSAVVRVAVRHAVARLDRRDRELVALRYGADLTARQIGELLGMETNAVEVALHRARARLREELDPAAGRKGPATVAVFRV